MTDLQALGYRPLRADAPALSAFLPVPDLDLVRSSRLVLEASLDLLAADLILPALELDLQTRRPSGAYRSLNRPECLSHPCPASSAA
jgi:hypothetical protein